MPHKRSAKKKKKKKAGTSRRGAAGKTNRSRTRATSSKRRAVRTKTPTTAKTVSPAPEPPAKPAIKSRLNDKDLAEFRKLLLAKRAELIGDVQQLTVQSLSDSPPKGSGSPIHPADMGSDNWEQEFTLELLDNERHLLKDIDAALNRIQEGIYGICIATGKPISKKRLRAQPWARYCIEYAREREKKGLRP